MVKARLTCVVLAAAWFLLGGAAAAAVVGRFETPRQVWAGQVFDLTLAWTVDWDDFTNLDGPLDWTSDPLVAEAFGPPALRGGAPLSTGTATIDLKTRAMALASGRIAIPVASQSMILRTGMIDMGDYQRAVTAPVLVKSNADVLVVRPLPPPPPGFEGAVGAFTVGSQIDKTDLRVGEAFTWTATVKGEGNWPSIRGFPARRASRDFLVVGKPKLVEDKAFSLFERSMSEAVVLVPQRIGRYVLSGFEWVAFDPKAGRYVRIAAPPITVEVKPGANGETGLPVDTSPPDAGEGDAPLPPMLSGEGRAIAPPSEGLWWATLAGFALALLASWPLLALRRAFDRDPERLARAAHRRLLANLERLAKVREQAEKRRRVRVWQQDVTARWKFNHVAPTPDSFSNDDWRRLWDEADRFLYGRDVGLPEDWTARALASLNDLGAPPPFAPGATFRRSNLLPVLPVLALMIVCALPRVGAAQDMSPAALRERVAEQPLDWRARHNLAVSLAAEGVWDQAAGQAAAAWVQHPSSQTERLWRMTAQKAGFSQEPGASAPRPSGWFARMFTLASPAAWRWAALALFGMATMGAVLGLLVRFGHARKALMRVGLGLVIAGLSGGLVSAAALSGYGVLGRSDAVLVWRSIPLRPTPVDTPADEEPAQLGAGAAGRVDRAYLGWRRVRFADGRSGWIRRENLIWVWSAPR